MFMSFAQLLSLPSKHSAKMLSPGGGVDRTGRRARPRPLFPMFASDANRAGVQIRASSIMGGIPFGLDGRPLPSRTDKNGSGKLKIAMHGIFL